MLDIEAIAIEFGDAGRRNHHSWRVREFDYVEGSDEAVAEGGCKTIVWRAREREEINTWRGGSADECSIAFVGGGRIEDWDCEECFSCHFDYIWLSKRSLEM